jgi:hypothetical protein
MSEEKEISVSEMLKLTGANTAEFMKQVAEHVDKLEQAVVQLQNRIAELEAQNGNNNTAQ